MLCFARRFFHCSGLLLGLVGSALAQTPASSASPAATQPAPVAGAAATPILKASSQLVLVDVVVTDRSHKPVHGLKASDFSVAENGVPQTIKNFDEHAALTVADVARFQPMPPLPAGVFTNETPAPPSGAVNLLLLDTLNTPLKDQAYVRQQLLAYLKSVPPGTRIAIFGLTEHLVLLQGFTSDPAVLRDYLEKHAGKGSPLLDDQVGGGGIQNSEADTLEDMGIDDDMVANVREFEAQQQSFQLQARIRYTLDAFNELARYLSGIPGRKNLVWFSGSFPISILPDIDGTTNNPFAFAATFEDEFRQAVDLLGRSQVVVYPVDARGITTASVFDATTTRNYAGARGNQRFSQDQSKYFIDTTNEHGTMSDMASATGGHAFFNTNDLTQAVADAIEEGSNFYTIAYAPTNATLDGRLRKIKISMGRSGLTLSYRQGYYADPPDKAVANPTVSASLLPDEAVTNTNGISPRDTLRMAMTRGAPTPTDILLHVGVFPITPASKPEDSPAPGNAPSPKAHGPWRRYAVNYQVDPNGIAFFRMPDGKVHADFDVIVFVYSADGVSLNAFSSRVQIAGALDKVREMARQGIIGHAEVSVPAKGEYFLRIGVRDLHRDHYGAVEVATSQVNKLNAATAGSAPTAAAK